jgi:hypothetical protein
MASARCSAFAGSTNHTGLLLAGPAQHCAVPKRKLTCSVPALHNKPEGDLVQPQSMVTTGGDHTSTPNYTQATAVSMLTGTSFQHEQLSHHCQ